MGGQLRAGGAGTTRDTLLAAAYAVIRRDGFKGASLDDILAGAGLTKGALYHHFSSKQALGYAVLAEIIEPYVLDFWLSPLALCDDPIDCMHSVIGQACEEIDGEELALGCPLNNLAQEMSPVDEVFRTGIDRIYRLWREGIADALRTGMRKGHVRADIDADRAATFIVAAVEGSIGLAKNAQDPEILRHCCAGLAQFLDGLRQGDRPMPVEGRG